MEHSLNKNCFFELPSLELPITVDELFDENDIHYVNGDFHKIQHTNTENILSRVGTVTTNCVWWNKGSITSSAYSKENIIGLGVAQIHNKKIGKKLHDFFYDTFHADFLAPIRSTEFGLKILPLSIFCFFPDAHNYWHFEGPRHNLPTNFNLIRNSSVVNFRLLGPTEDDDTSVQWATVDEKFETELNRLSQAHLDNNLSVINDLNNSVHISQGVDNIVSNKWNNSIKIVAERKGFHNPFCMNVKHWHRVLLTDKSRCTFRILGNKDFDFSYYEQLHLEGKFLK